MAKITGPLMSVNASGVVGERLVFSQRKSGQQARFQKAQKDIITGDRTAQRANYSNGVIAWLAQYYGANIYGLSSYGESQDSYRNRVGGEHITGYNLYMREYLNGI